MNEAFFSFSNHTLQQKDREEGPSVKPLRTLSDPEEARPSSAWGQAVGAASAPGT